MATLLLVLRIIGMVLLGVLSLLALLVLIFLFVPLRYKADCEYSEDISFTAKCSFLLHLISVCYTYEQDNGTLKVRICGIKLNLDAKKKKDTVENTKTGDTDTSDKDSNDSKEANGKKKEQNTDKKKDTKDTILHYIEILKDDDTKQAFYRCGRVLKRLIKKILPRKCNIRIEYGMEDPFVTSTIISVFDIFYVYFDRCLTLIPVYNEKKLEIEGNIKGHICAATVVYAILGILLNKNCRSFIRRIRNE